MYADSDDDDDDEDDDDADHLWDEEIPVLTTKPRLAIDKNSWSYYRYIMCWGSKVLPGNIHNTVTNILYT